MRETIPDFATHYYRARRRPFLNLSDLDDGAASAVLAELAGADEQRESHRRFGSRYLELRRATVDLARRRFVDAGGEPLRTAPHYFVLGRSAWFAGLYSDTRELRLDLADLPPAVTSFTYLDSMTTLNLGEKFGVVPPPAEHLGKVYPLQELSAVVQKHGLPGGQMAEGYGGYQYKPLGQYLEIQLWADEPLKNAYPPAD